MKSSRALSSVRFVGRWLFLGAKFAAFISICWLSVALIGAGLTWIGRGVGLDPTSTPLSLLGWLLATVMLLAVFASALHPRRVRQRECMHSDPHAARRRPEDGSPTITWLQSELVATNRKSAYRRYWCTRCLQVWIKR
jgi:hypothetical protein